MRAISHLLVLLLFSVQGLCTFQLLLQVQLVLAALTNWRENEIESFLLKVVLHLFALFGFLFVFVCFSDICVPTCKSVTRKGRENF